MFTRARKKERKKGIMPYDFNDLINSIIYIEKRDNIYLYTFKNVLNSSCKYVHFFYHIKNIQNVQNQNFQNNSKD